MTEMVEKRSNVRLLWLNRTFHSFSADGVLFVVPPHITALGEERRLDDLRGHPGVGACCRHFGGFVPLPGQAKVCDFQRLPPDVIILDFFK